MKKRSIRELIKNLIVVILIASVAIALVLGGARAIQCVHRPKNLAGRSGRKVTNGKPLIKADLIISEDQTMLTYAVIVRADGTTLKGATFKIGEVIHKAIEFNPPKPLTDDVMAHGLMKLTPELLTVFQGGHAKLEVETDKERFEVVLNVKQ